MADTGEASIEINAEPEEILGVVTDIEAYPDWMGAFKDARIIETDEEGRPRLAEFVVDARIRTLHYTLEYEYPDNGISWHNTEGDVKEIKGSYTFEPAGDKTKVTYSYEIDPGFSIPGFLRRQGVKMMVSSALNDLKRRTES
jgi:ribosome-associated toxin RatA of RatAB toxin-antitoxin module